MSIPTLDIHSIFSYDSNVMLAAIISLLLVILFVLLLHIYAKWFLSNARQRRRSSITVSHVFGPTGFHHFHTFTFETSLSSSPTKGLDPSVIASIPLFVYKFDEHKNGLECIICLSAFEDDDVGRNLPNCHHAFHVECIDMWLQSHSSCPICRAPAVCENEETADRVDNGNVNTEQEYGELLDMESDYGNSRVEILVTGISIPNSGNENEGSIDSLSVCSSLSTQSLPSSVGSSLKRMLSRNRSEQKVFPASNDANELDA